MQHNFGRNQQGIGQNNNNNNNILFNPSVRAFRHNLPSQRDTFRGMVNISAANPVGVGVNLGQVQQRGAFERQVVRLLTANVNATQQNYPARNVHEGNVVANVQIRSQNGNYWRLPHVPMSVRGNQFTLDHATGQYKAAAGNDIGQDLVEAIHRTFDQLVRSKMPNFSGDHASNTFDYQVVNVELARQDGFVGVRNPQSIQQLAHSRRAYNNFDLNRTMSVRHSKFAATYSVLTRDGLCLMQSIEYIIGCLENGFKKQPRKTVRGGQLGRRQEGRRDDRASSMDDSSLYTKEAFYALLRSREFTPAEEQQLLGGEIFPGLEAYAKKCPQLVLGFYNLHDDSTAYVREGQLVLSEKRMQELSVSEINTVEWWLVYENMHVCPLSSEEIKNLMTEILQRHETSQTFAAYKRRHRQRDSRNHGAAADQEEIKDGGGDDDEVDDSSSTALEDEFHMEGEEDATSSSKGSMELHPAMNIERARFLYTRYCAKKNTNPDAFPFDIYCQKILKFGLVEGSPLMEEARTAITKRFEKVGLCAFDFETVIDNSLDPFLVGNTRPFLLHVYGTVYYDAKHRAEVAGKPYMGGAKGKQRVRCKEVDKSFAGLDCVDQFVNWIESRGIIQQQLATADFVNVDAYLPEEKKHQRRLASKKDRLRKYVNVFVAHNGARFDNRFLIQRMSRIADVDFTGTIKDTKKLTFKNLQFYDSCLLLPGSLAKICRDLQATNQKFPYDIENVTLTNWESKLPSVRKYCRQDCVALHEVYRKFVLQRALTYFNGTAFPKTLFPITQSSSALDIMKTCYLQEHLVIVREILAYETESYVGGLCNVFSAFTRNGVSFDINASYPAAMQNLLPTNAIQQPGGGYVISHHEQPVEFSKLKATAAVNTNLYEVTFAFPADCEFPSLQIRREEEGSLIPVVNSLNHKQWIWGVQINFAVQRQGAHIVAYREIQYTQSRFMRRMIAEFYELRQAAKRQKNAFLDLLYKLLMNSCYGKFGQKIQPKVVYGHVQKIQDLFREQLQQLQGAKAAAGGVDIISINPVISHSEQLVEVKYTTGQESVTQIGGFVRLASYITAVAKVNLLKGQELANKVVTKYIADEDEEVKVEAETFIKYIDTDCFHVAVDSAFSGQDRAYIAALYDKYLQGEYVVQKVFSYSKGADRALVLLKEHLYESKEQANLLRQQVMQALNALTFVGKKYALAVMGDVKSFREQANHHFQQVDLNTEQWRLYSDVLAEKYRTYKEDFRSRFCGEIMGGWALQVATFFRENTLVKDMYRLRDVDPCNLTENFCCETLPAEQLLPLIDEHRCGAFKMEKFIIVGYYCAAKMYALHAFCNDSQQMQEFCKLKGVVERERRFDHYREMYESLNLRDNAQQFGANFAEEELLQQVRYYEMQQFRVLDTGVRISDIGKYITPTLTKRFFMDAKAHRSRPFADINEWFIYFAHTQDVNSRMRDERKKYQLRRDAPAVALQEQVLSIAKDVEMRAAAVVRMREAVAADIEVNENQFTFDVSGNQARERMLSPQVFAKVTFKTRVEACLEGGVDGSIRAYEYCHAVKDTFTREAMKCFQMYARKIDSTNCRKIRLMNQVLLKVHFLDCVTQATYDQQQGEFKQTPYQNMVEMVERKVSTSIDTATDIYINVNFIAMIEQDFAAIIALFDKAGFPEMHRFTNVLLCEEAALKADKELAEEHVNARLQAQQAAVDKFLKANKKRFHQGQNKNHADMILVRASLTKHIREGRLPLLQYIFSVVSHRYKSPVAAALYVIHEYMLSHEVFALDKNERRKRNYSEGNINASVGKFLRLVIADYFADDAATKKDEPAGMYGVVNKRHVQHRQVRGDTQGGGGGDSQQLDSLVDDDDDYAALADLVEQLQEQL